VKAAHRENERDAVSSEWPGTHQPTRYTDARQKRQLSPPALSTNVALQGRFGWGICLAAAPECSRRDAGGKLGVGIGRAEDFWLLRQYRRGGRGDSGSRTGKVCGPALYAPSSHSLPHHTENVPEPARIDHKPQVLSRQHVK